MFYERQISALDAHIISLQKHIVNLQYHMENARIDHLREIKELNDQISTLKGLLQSASKAHRDLQIPVQGDLNAEDEPQLTETVDTNKGNDDYQEQKLSNPKPIPNQSAIYHPIQQQNAHDLRIMSSSPRMMNRNPYRMINRNNLFKPNPVNQNIIEPTFVTRQPQISHLSGFGSVIP